MVLRDSFISSAKSKIVMIACTNPGSSNADHTINTLRYAERLKTEKKVEMINLNRAKAQEVRQTHLFAKAFASAQLSQRDLPKKL